MNPKLLDKIGLVKRVHFYDKILKNLVKMRILPCKKWQKTVKQPCKKWQKLLTIFWNKATAIPLALDNG